MGTPRFDTGSWPLVRIGWPQQTTLPEFHPFEEEFDKLLRRREPFGVVLDIENVERPPADVRAAVAEYQRTRRAEVVKHLKAFAFIVNAPVLRGVLTAIRWLVPAAYPEANFTTRFQAEAWVLEKLRDAGVELTRTRLSG